ncbi:MotA/TolQ/ExbB proton channel family protein [Actimicrobium antarcticum]|uniref:Biopolymer transport protein ExbB n=1 Tax=Actimicrobium antarcticum TaxID=1051899 RepID=A0ABP7SLG2_9BURK
MFLPNRLSAIAAALLISVSSAAALLAPQTASAADTAPIMIAQATTETAAPAAAAPAIDSAAGTATASMEPAKEQVSNPYGLDALWKGGDFVARGTLIILVLMSMSSWYVIITKVIDQLKLGGQAADANKKFWSANSVDAGIATLKDGSPFRYIAETGVKSTVHNDGALLEHIDLNTWVTMSIQRAVEKVQSRLQDGLALLATVGSTAPFVGLFGTVWGIYHALTAIGIAGQASIDKVAGPVGEALIMTAIGLAVAVPAVLGYNFLVRRNKTAMENVRAFSSDLHSVLLSGVMSTANKKG